MSIKIDQAFTTAILGASLNLDVVHEGGIWSYWNGASYDSKTGIYDPDAQRPYVKIKHFPAEKGALSLAHTDEQTGVLQALVRYPVDLGSHDAKDKAEEILTLFKIGSVHTYSGQSFKIESNRRDEGIPVNGFYEVTVRANYIAFITR